MSFLDLVKNRFSARSFTDKIVEKEKIDLILEVARLAPSAVNLQPWKFFVVSDKLMLSKLAETYSREWFKTAPLCIVACGNHSESWKRFDGKDHCER